MKVRITEGMAVTLELALEHGLTAEEYARATAIAGGRELRIAELGVFSAMWNEHCSYKSSRVHLRRLPTTGPRVLVGPGENAGVVDIGDGLGVCFKMESHNHPSFIEPHQGAATGVGGILRDIFTMGARPIALLNSLRFGPTSHPRTRALVAGVVEGIGSYGNCMGVPTVGGEVAFHESYAGNILVNAMCLGLVRTDAIFLGQAEGVGNPLLYVGAKTGKDGIHGATMASDAFDEEALDNRPTVQVGDPFTEKRLLEACLELFAQGLVVGIQDMGAAGLTCSTFEMAGRAGNGVDVELSLVPTREAGMTAYEILLSESQERMLLVTTPERVAAVAAIFAKWDLDCAVIGRVTDDGQVRLRHHGQLVVDLPALPLSTEAPVYERPIAEPPDATTRRSLQGVDLVSADPSADLLALVGSANLGSRRWVWRQFDHHVRLGTRAGPGGDAALLRVHGTQKGLGLTVDCNSRWVWLFPQQGAAMAVAEGVRNLACVGAEAIGVTDCLNFGNPQRPEVMWELSSAIDGLALACRALEVPIVSGNVSLYNESELADGTRQNILPTPSIATVGLREGLSDASRAPSSAFVSEGHIVAHIGPMRGETLGGSEWLYTTRGLTQGHPPTFRADAERATSAAVRALVARGVVASAHDLSDGGLLVALAECAACHPGKTRVGATLALTTDEDATRASFGEGGARVLVSYPPEAHAAVEATCLGAGAPLTVMGKTGGDRLALTLNHSGGRTRIDLGLADLHAAWDGALERAVGLNA